MAGVHLAVRSEITSEIPTARDGVVHLTGAFELELGGSLQPCDVAYRSYGPGDAPAVIVLGGISAGRRIVDEPDGTRGWWPEVVGNRCVVDTSRFHVIGIDYLGGVGSSTGPGSDWPEDEPFPAVTTGDQGRAITAALDHLGIDRLHAIVGASYGGMVALALAARFPERARHAVVLCAPHEPNPMATALRSLQRRVVRLGLATGAAEEAMRIARGIAMTTYRSADEFASRFTTAPTATPAGFRFPIDDYLEHCGRAFGEAFSPAAFLCLSESLDLHRVDPSTVRVPTTLVGVDTDRLVPLAQMRELRHRLGSKARLVEIASLYGHDAFLKETGAVGRVLRRALEDERG